jgi:hypothetical protein
VQLEVDQLEVCWSAHLKLAVKTKHHTRRSIERMITMGMGMVSASVSPSKKKVEANTAVVARAAHTESKPKQDGRCFHFLLIPQQPHIRITSTTPMKAGPHNDFGEEGVIAVALAAAEVAAPALRIAAVKISIIVIRIITAVVVARVNRCDNRNSTKGGDQ